jgi:L-rhamnose mutarotase
MKSFAQALDLKNEPGIVAAYKEHHKRVYPEVLAALRAAGIGRMKIFLLGTHLFMYFEAPDGFDPQRDYMAYATNARCIAWETLMRGLQQRVPEAGPTDWWTPMELVFDLEAAR